jgi:PTH1 family peptidyl-tRNA hydrolase
MKLIVGLGNPGRRYEKTRHNIGYAVLAEFARRLGVAAKPREKFHGELLEAEVGGEKLLLLAPTTYMNHSGRSVAAARDFYDIPPADVLVICDDLNLPVGKLRFRSGGSSGGQKGLADVIVQFQTDDVPRLRIGIGAPPPAWDAADYVLSRFASDEVPEMEKAVQKAAEAVEVWVREGLSACTNRYNG